MGDRKKSTYRFQHVTSWRPVQSVEGWDTSQRTVKKPSPFDRLKRALNFEIRKKENSSSSASQQEKKKQTKKNTPVQWQDDEKLVRAGTCSFNVKYLGGIEVRDSRGIDVCEQAIQALINQKSKHIKAILHISGDALRIVDKTNKCLVVDQTIEKVSFCAPDHHHAKGFAYISRDGTTRQWFCHGFLAIKEKGERLSHAVGCAFEICLEKKQQRDQHCKVTVEYTPKGTSFTRLGSFRTSSIIERMVDPQSGIVAEPIPSIPSNHAFERPRPKGKSPDVFNRSLSICISDLNRTGINLFQQQNSMTPNDSLSIRQMKYKNSLTDTIPEETGITSTISEFQQLALSDSTKPAKSSHIPLRTLSNISFTNSPSTIPEQVEPTTAISINDAFNSNLNALIQSNHPTNPFSPYGYSIAAQSPDAYFRQSNIFTPKRGTNPFDDDLIRR